MRGEAGVAAVVMAAATLIGVGPTAAQEGDEPIERLDVSPTSGPPGTVITVHGENCISTIPGSPMEIVDIVLLGDSAEAFVAVTHFDIHDGAWTGRLTVPAQADPDDAFVLTVTCNGLGPEDNHIVDFTYEPVDFDVTAPATTVPTTPPTTAPTPAPAPAPPAAPIVAQPSFTG
jgi:hypothetical protein